MRLYCIAVLKPRQQAGSRYRLQVAVSMSAFWWACSFGYTFPGFC